MTRVASSLAPRAGFTHGLPLGEAQLRQLRTFAAVVDAGGLQPGAAAVQVDLSTVSRQFAELEAWLDVRLARRGRGGFVLTAEGERLLDHARRLFEALSNFSDEATALSGASREHALDRDAPIVADPYAGERPAPSAGSRAADAHADNIEAVALLVCSGRYAGYLPDHMVQGTPALHALRAVLPERHSYRQDIVLTCRVGKAAPGLGMLLGALAA